ncbi:MAG TPA: response regulator [Nitrososphaera sp.]|nr:response regulator [Nitrososphaera sp.]
MRQCLENQQLVQASLPSSTPLFLPSLLEYGLLKNSLHRLVFAMAGERRASSGGTADYRSQRSEGSKPRVMIVDDERDIAWVFATGLQMQGFNVELYTDSKVALDKFKPNHYAILLLDVRMPGMSGFELYSEILKKDPAQRACFASGYEIHGEDDIKLLPGLDSETIIKKPISISDLASRIKHEIGK